jgi:unsaturated chondroitin disaccharide hydrolase
MRPEAAAIAVSGEERLRETVEACVAGAAPVCRQILAAPEDVFPQLNTRSGNYSMARGYLPADRGFRWAGFLAGRLWLLHDLTGDLLLRDAAMSLARRISGGIQGHSVDRGNVGFDVYHGICLGYEVTGSAELRELAVTGAAALDELWCQSAGVYRQNGWMDAFVSETPACLLPLLWARRHRVTQGGAERLREHVLKSLEGGMLRADGSVQHRLYFEAGGKITTADTSQGYQPHSTWGRAQAWMLHSLASCLETFPDARIRAAFERAVGWYLDKLPADGVLYYDFDDERLDEIPRDSCGTLIAAVALLRAADLGVSPARCREAALRSEQEILENYVAPGGVVLHGSWGAGEGKTRWNSLFPRQDVMPYGNYWLIELLHRRLRPDSTVFDFGPPRVERAATSS